MRTRCPLRFKAAFAIIVFAGGVRAAAAAQAAVDHGEILLDQLSCTACHAAPLQAQDRFVTREGPRLGAQGLRLTPQWLRVFLTAPDQVHPGTHMPDMLHAMTPDEKGRTIEDLTQYLLSREAPADSPFDCPPALIERGRALYHTVGCVACHAPTELPQRTTDDPQSRAAMQALQASSEPFDDLARMTSVQQLAAFLQNPVRYHPAGRMPSMKLTGAEATAIAAYLLREQMPAGTQSAPGLAYEYFEKRFANLPNFDRLKPVASGSVPTFDISPRQRDDYIAMRFRGSIAIRTAGQYTFYTNSDDGSNLLIDGRLVVANDGIHPMTERSGSINLTPGSHAITVLYFNALADLGLAVSWEGPGIARETVPASVLSHPGVLMTPLGDQPFAADPAGAARGRALFARLNCAACHQGDMAGTPAKPLAELAVTGDADCLSPTPSAGLPKYALTPDDRAAIRKILSDPARLSQPLDARASIERTMTLLNCYACHERDLQGGPQGLRRDYFSSLPPALDLGDEGRLPPRLTGVGAKLQEGWMDKVLCDGASVRPYMATRMPQFGRENVGFLPAAFLAADGAGVMNPDLHGDLVAQKTGRKLVGVTGLGCIACHNFEGHPSLGIPAMDLTVMAERLQTGWFHNYLVDPQSLRPGTRMPSFWPDGKALKKDIDGGDAGLQIAALWTYLSQGPSADLPDGLIRGRMELIADKQAVIYRNFIQGVSPRAIAVGYPEKSNLAFDADEMRIALIWHGSFIDAGQHRTGRGMGATPPMGYDVLTGPPGPPFALLAGPDDPWPASTGKDAGYRFRGYRLDDVLRPAFSYDFGTVRVTDYPVAVPGRDDSAFKRTLTFQASALGTNPANLYMRAAVGNDIKRLPNGDFLVDGRLTLRFVEPGVISFAGQPSAEAPAPTFSGNGATIRKSQGRMELLVPVHFTGSKASIEEDYTW